MTNFDRFTERAKVSLQLAQEEARRFRHDHLGTEHLLLGLVREGDGIAAQALNASGVDLPKLRAGIEFVVGRGDSDLSEIGLTPRSKKALEIAIEESRRLNHEFVGTEHLLLGLLHDPESIACGILDALQVDLKALGAKVTELLGIPPNPPSEEGA
jgi:ATP-dependent Clp protease ATP-binding subunit ClpC